MSQLNSQINLDRAKCAEETASKGEEKMSHSSKKTPWHLRFAPSRLRKSVLAVLAIATVLTPISALAVHPVVAFIYRWAAGEILSDAKQDLMDRYLNAKMATASVNGAYWISNSYSYKGTVSDGIESNPWAVWFLVPSDASVQVSQGHEVDDDPSGTRNGVTMSEEEAESYMEEQGWYAKIYFYGYAVNEDNHRVLVSVIARGDKFSEVKKETLAALREEREDDTYEWGDLWTKRTTNRRVGNHKMVSKFNDLNDEKIDELGFPGPSNETKFYWGTVSWTKYNIDRLGNKGSGENDKRRVRFRSYRESPRRRQLCRINQIIEDQHINESITRQLKKVETWSQTLGGSGSSGSGWGLKQKEFGVRTLERTDFEVIHID